MSFGNQALADSYNEQARRFNKALGSIDSGLSGFRDELGTFNPDQLWDDPRTANVNENVLDGFSGRIDDFVGEWLPKLAIPERPEFTIDPDALAKNADWAAYVNSYDDLSHGFGESTYDDIADFGRFHWNKWGKAENRNLPQLGGGGTNNMPHLVDLNMDDYNRLVGEWESLQGDIEGLKGRRKQAVGAARDFVGGFARDLGSNYRTIQDLEPHQIDDIRHWQGVLDGWATEYNYGDHRPIIEQLLAEGEYTDLTSQLDSAVGYLDSLDSQHGGLETAHEAERTRLSDYLTEAYGQFGNLSIADLEGLDELERGIDEVLFQNYNFDNDLGYDFSQETAGLNALLGRIQDMKADRTLEEQRIQGARTGFSNTLNNLINSASNGSIYSKSSIDALNRQYESLGQGLNNFTSDLEFDFSDIDLSAANEAIESLRSRRARALDGIRDDILGSGIDGLADIELHDEESMRDVMDALRAAEIDLSAFSGGRAPELRDMLDGHTETVEGRLGELNEYRSSLEQRAQELQAAIEEREFRSLDEVEGQRSEYESMQEEIELYNALSAMDELDAILAELNTERDRLDIDAQNVANRDRVARQRVYDSMNRFGIPKFKNYPLLDPYNYSSGRDEEDWRNWSPSAFSAGLGVG